VNRDGRTIGVVLSGALDDGADGLRTIALAGGLAVVQDPTDALIPSMPRSAIDAARVDLVLPADEIGRKLPELLAAPAGENAMDERTKQTVEQEVAISAMDASRTPETPPGKPSVFGCPDCGGVLWEVDQEHGLRFRCRVGHAYAVDSLLDQQKLSIENAFWIALRALEERGALLRRLVARAEKGGSKSNVRRYAEEQQVVASRAKALRDVILSGILGNGADSIAS
jgi:two-component system, chemotaxis family, protein-glutamate methylesterase/glutaminase